MSVIGSEIIFSQPKGKIQPQGSNDDNNSAEDSLSTSNPLVTKTGAPLDPSNGLAFGFIEGAIVDQLSENNQWKERTSAMERVEDRFVKLLNEGRAKQSMSESNATSFLAYIYKFIPDINFKISLSSINIVSLLLRNDLANIKKYFQTVLGHLVEKFSDSKQVVRDAVLECCSCMLKHTKPFLFANQISKNLQHANHFVREGALTLIIRCVLESTRGDKGPRMPSLKPQIPGTQDQGLVSLLTNSQIIEEISFLVKVEDKKQLQ